MLKFLFSLEECVDLGQPRVSLGNGTEKRSELLLPSKSDTLDSPPVVATLTRVFFMLFHC